MADCKKGGKYSKGPFINSGELAVNVDQEPIYNVGKKEYEEEQDVGDEGHLLVGL